MGPSSGFVARIDFLGTGNAFSPPGRMHALALLDSTVLVDAPPTVLVQLRRAGVSPADIEHLLFTHWHADHTFGFPFLLLERQHVSDPDATKTLGVHLRPGGRDILDVLCRTGFPGSLDAALDERANWSESESGELAGTDWSYERFPVCHTPETDPHGYELVHSSGFRLLHCGDSGPCDEIEQRAANAIEAVNLVAGVLDRRIERYKSQTYRSERARQVVPLGAQQAEDDSRVPAYDGSEVLSAGNLVRVKRFQMNP